MIAHSALAGNQALSLDGTKGYVQVWDSPSLDITDSVTISVWFYFQGGLPGPGIAQPGIIQKDGPDSWGRYGLWTFDDKGKVQLCIFPIAGLQKCFISTRSLIMDSWNHIAGVYDGNTMCLYVNGEMAGSEDLSAPISTSNERLYIGADPTEGRGLYVHGIVDEVCIWNTAHTQAKIQAKMNIKPTDKEAGLVGYWNFDDGTADDLTANGNHGELIGNAEIITPDRSWPFTVEPAAKLTTTWAALKR